MKFNLPNTDEKGVELRFERTREGNVRVCANGSAIFLFNRDGTFTRLCLTIDDIDAGFQPDRHVSLYRQAVIREVN